MWATILSGFMLIYIIGLDGGWLYTKLFLITLLIIYFYSLNRYRLILLQDKCKKSGKFFRFYNEVPTILMLLIVAMVILKPF
jgi:putative membrane protein